jgi:hypothetical protein
MNDKDFVKTIFINILKQSIYDWKAAEKSNNLGMKQEIRRFFRSEWAETILGFLDINIDAINDKLRNTQPKEDLQNISELELF